MFTEEELQMNTFILAVGKSTSINNALVGNLNQDDLNTTLRIIDGIKALIRDYGGKSTEWAKMRSTSFIDKTGLRTETHWYQNIRTGKRVLYKTKTYQTVIKK